MLPCGISASVITGTNGVLVIFLGLRPTFLRVEATRSV
jgi:hypothetical protein